jgi:ATP-binding cassette subfamily C protein CydD
MKLIDLQLLKRTGSGPKLLLLALVLGVIQALLTVSQALLLVHLITKVLSERAPLQDLSSTLLFLTAAFLLRSFITFFHDRVADQSGHSIQQEVRQLLIAKCASQSSHRQSQLRTDQLSQLATTGIRSLENYLCRFLPRLMVVATLAATILITFAILDPISALATFLAISLILIAKKTTEEGESRSTSSRFTLMSRIIISLAFALIVIVSSARLTNASLTLAEALLVVTLLWQLFTSLLHLTPDIDGARDDLERMRKIFELLDASTENDAPAAEDDLPSLGRIKELRWTDCEVLYNDDHPVTFRWGIATTGKMTVITGPSGSGKTSLIASLMRIVELSEGRIFVETSKGTFRIEEFPLDYWLDQISWIPELPYFISGTIESNLKLIKPRANRERLAEVLRAANLDPDQLPNGLQSSIGSKDGEVSAQHLRQLALARAILKDSPIIIADAPKGSLESEVEFEINKTLKELSREGKLVILVTSESESLTLADRRITLQADRYEPVRILEAAQ